MRVKGGFAENLEAHLREFVEPALRQGGAPLQGEVERVEQRVVDVKDGALADFVDGVVDALDDLRLLVRRNVLVLDLAEQRDDLLRGRLKQVCVVHRSDLERGRLHQFLVE